MKQFSFFSSPITNTKPSKNFTLLDAYHYIIGDTAKERTQKLRSFADTKQSRIFKAANFDYCTFSGTFASRTDKALIHHSGLLCIDFDHLQNLDSLRSQLLQDEYFDTQLLFRSPSGDGLKWVIEIDISQTPHADYFRAVANYLFQTYGVEADKSGKDISRACFLPHDPNCFINPKISKV
ncbi:MAG TPA: BT4734/BF3469 family protein [Paludibacteraceae bacterium]|nr:BT4734/BF3469 family protein [Paludibacteraceae bacterium]